MFLPSAPSVSQKHDKQLLSHRSPRHFQILSRSTLGLVDVYNLFPAQVVGQKSVASMQHELQTLLKFRAQNGDSCWLHTISPRVALHEAPVANCFHDFCFVDTFDVLSNSEDLRQHAGGACIVNLRASLGTVFKPRRWMSL